MELFPLGDSAVVIRFGASIDEATHRRVRAVCARLGEWPIPGVTEYVPAFASITVHYDAATVGQGEMATPYERVEAALAPVLAGLEVETIPPARVVEVPVCYGGTYGPDLGYVADHAGLTTEDVVRLHASGDYRVYMIGFAPGFPYLGGLSDRIVTPRRSVPRTTVPAGSVGIAGRQTGIYPVASPGGWQIIGRTPLRLFSPDRDPPARLRVGDRLRFREITPDEWAAIAAADEWAVARREIRASRPDRESAP